jgi:mandelate racemase
VKAYNSNGLWLQAPEVVAAEAIALRDEGGFTALKLRLGRDRPSDDLAAIHAIRRAVGGDVELMADFNQGLHLGEALQRCHMIDGEGLAWRNVSTILRQPSVEFKLGCLAFSAVD